MNEAKIHPSSANTDLPMFNHWDVPPTQRDIEKIVTTEHRPISTLSSSSNIEFRFRTAINEHVLMHKTNLYLKMSVKLTPKAAPVANANWASLIPANYLLHSMFKNIEVIIGGKETSSKPATYSYRAFLDAKFGFTDQAKNTHLSSALWTNTAKERTDLFTPDSDKTDQSVSNEVELMGRLHLDFAFQPKTLVGGSDVRIILTPHDPSFYLQFTGTHNILSAAVTFHDSSLYVKSALLYGDFVDYHNQGLLKSPAKYILPVAEVRHDTITKGSIDASFDNICNGLLPNLVIVQLIESDAYNGSYSKDPFVFKPNNLIYCCSYVNGHQVPLNAYQMDFDKDQYIRTYLSLPQAINQDGMDSIFNISRKTYKDNCHIAFNYSQDGSTGAGTSVNALRHGNLRIVLRFSKPVPAALTAIFYCTFDKCLEIDETRTPIP